MNNKFKNVSVEEDTILLLQEAMKFDKYDVRYEKWFWDGITGESVIFLSADITDLTDDEVVDLIRQSSLSLKADQTITRGEEFTFVNFNFVSE